MIGCLWTPVRKQPIIALYFESGAELKFYNLEAWCFAFCCFRAGNRPGDEFCFSCVFDVFYSEYACVYSVFCFRSFVSRSYLLQVLGFDVLV